MFMWAVTQAIYPTENNAGRISKKLQEDARKLSWDGIEFPTPFSNEVYEQFEKNNDVGISVYGHRGEEVYVMRNPGRIFGKSLHFFLAGNDKGGYHYCVVQDKSKLMASQRGNVNARSAFCPYCNKSFLPLKRRGKGEDGKWFTEVIAMAGQRLAKHVCQGVGHNTYTPAEILPEEGKNLLEYNSFHLSFKILYVSILTLSVLLCLCITIVWEKW